MPALIYFQTADKGAIPFLPAIGAYYIVFYGMPVFLHPLAYLQGQNVVLYERIVLSAMDGRVLLLVVAGIASMFAAFYLSKQIRMPRFRLPNPVPDANVLNGCYWLLITASLAYRLIPSLQELPSVGQFLSPAGYVALGGFFLQWHSGQLSKPQVAMILLIVVPLEIYERIRFLFLTDVVLMALFLILVLWRCGRLRLLALAIVLSALIVPTYSVTTTYRGAGSTFVEKMKSSVSGLFRTIQSSQLVTRQGQGGIGDVTYDPRISPLVNRIGHIWIFQTVFEQSPERVPYWGGYTYRPLLTSTIPRALYSDKPEERAGAEFGIRYGFGEEKSNSTSFNIPWLVELLANFGPIGVILGMALLGFVLGSLDKFLNSAESSNVEFLIDLVLMFRLIYQESNLSVMTGSLVLQLVAFYIFFRFIPQLFSHFALNRPPRR